MDAMYAQRTKLEAIFHYFDRDGNGTISRSEFHQGCNLLNTTLPPEQQLTDYDHILDLMDFDQSDSIDINEFFEVRTRNEGERERRKREREGMFSLFLCFCVCICSRMID